MYKEHINEEVLEWIRKCKQSNIPDSEICKKLNIGKDLVIKWKKEYTEFNDAFKKGREELLLDMENILYKRALGYDVDDTEVTVKKDSEGKIIETIIKKKKKHIWSDSNLQLILKRLEPDKWGDNGNKINDEDIKIEIIGQENED